MILGDVMMTGNHPPDKMTIVDPAKVLKARSEEQREWVKRASLFQSIWDNGKVYVGRHNHHEALQAVACGARFHHQSMNAGWVLDQLTLAALFIGTDTCGGQWCPRFVCEGQSNCIR